MTMREQVRRVAREWSNQYSAGRVPDKLDKLNKLNLLDVEKADKEDVANIIGNGFWVCEAQCHECSTKTWDAVLIGEPPDYESKTATICIDCLKRAVAMIEGKNETARLP